MKKRRIMIALEQLGVGGIETFALNQVKALNKKGIEVYVIAKKGIYYEEFKKNGAKIIDYKFEDSIYYNKKKIKEMCKILKDNKIDEVHINQFPLMNVLMPACILTNTPYVAYLHMAAGIINDPVHNAYDYFERQFITYNKFFKMFFNKATKIVAITEAIKKHTAERYNIDKRKIIVRPNAIDTKAFSTTKKVTQIKKVLLISRISIEKKNVIINGIKLYQALREKDSEITLTIAGDGNLKYEIEEFVKTRKIPGVTIVGNISNVKEVMEEHDLVIAVDRCILEALSLGRLAVISGYDEMKNLVTKRNIDSCISENFCGINQQNRVIEKVANELMKLDKKKIETITQENLNIIRKKLDIYQNVFFLDDKYIHYDYEEYINDLFEISEIIGKAEIEYYNKSEEIWKTYKNYEKSINRRYGLTEGLLNIIRRGLRFIKRKIKGN